MLDDVGWELFIEDCAEQLKVEKEYVLVKRLGGPGDKGRDICGYTQQQAQAGTWDLYQAKYYGSPLTPGEFAPDLAKFLVHLQQGAYTLPRNYYLCSIRGSGTKLFDLLMNPGQLGPWILGLWKEKNGDFGSFKQSLTPVLEKFISDFPFEIVKECTRAALLEIHSRNEKKHWEKFGQLPVRGDNPPIPPTPVSNEQIYTEELLKVYTEHVGTPISFTSAIPTSQLRKHFNAQRRLFYSAEGLNRFSRDKLPGAFDALIDEVEIGIGGIVSVPYSSGMERLTETLKTANSLRVETNALKSRLQSGDLQGTCHHLANEGRVTWVNDDSDDIII